MKFKLLKLSIFLAITTSISVGCSKGSTFRIVTEDPTEDFVVRCDKGVDHIILRHASSGYAYPHNVVSAKSGENVSCGTIYGRGHKSSVYAYHPTYVRELKKKGKKGSDVDDIFYMTPSLDRIDQLKEKYEAGFFDDNKYPLRTFNEKLNYACGFSGESREKYMRLLKMAKPLDFSDYTQLRNRYYEETVECNRKREAVRHSYGLSTYHYYSDGEYLKPIDNKKLCDRYNLDNCQYRPHFTLAQLTIYMWGRETWSQYLEGTEEEIYRFFGIKRTFLIYFKRHWFLIDAYTKKDIEKKYREFTVYEENPSWMSDSEKEGLVKYCDGTDMHWDIDVEPTGWLADYASGNFYKVVCQ